MTFYNNMLLSVVEISNASFFSARSDISNVELSLSGDVGIC